MDGREEWDSWSDDDGSVTVGTGRAVAAKADRTWRRKPWDCMRVARLDRDLKKPTHWVSGVEIRWPDVLGADFMLPAVSLAASAETGKASTVTLKPDPMALLGFKVMRFRFVDRSFEEALAAIAKRNLNRGEICWDREVDAFGEWIAGNGLDTVVETCARPVAESPSVAAAATKAVTDVMRLNPEDHWLFERAATVFGWHGFDRRTSVLAAAACVACLPGGGGAIDSKAAWLFLSDVAMMPDRFRHLSGGDGGDPDTAAVHRQAAAVSDRQPLDREALIAIGKAFRREGVACG